MNCGQLHQNKDDNGGDDELKTDKLKNEIEKNGQGSRRKAERKRERKGGGKKKERSHSLFPSISKGLLADNLRAGSVLLCGK